jgi:CheY-like chemotaxis protein
VRLRFGLLWIENDYSSNEEGEIRAAASNAGFELEITISKSGSDIEALADEQKKFHLFDLVLLDLKLDGGVQGDKLAIDVRRLFRSTPILFYSGSDGEAGLRTRMANERVEGVFCAMRSNFTERAGQLIAEYGQNLNRLVGMRGLAVEVVAEVDNICRDVFSKVAVGELETIANDFLIKAVTSQSEDNLKKYPALKNLNDRLHHQATDSTKKFNLLRKFLQKHIDDLPEGEQKDHLRDLSNSIREYPTQVLMVRNTLGHALEVKNDKGWLINDRNGEPFMTVADFPRYRSAFIEHRRSIQEIARLLIANK